MPLAGLPTPRPSRLNAAQLSQALGFVAGTLRGAPELCAAAASALPILSERHSCFALAVMAGAVAWPVDRIERPNVSDGFIVDVDDFFNGVDEAWTEWTRHDEFLENVGGWARSRKVVRHRTSNSVSYVQAAFAFIPMMHVRDDWFPAADPDYWRVLWHSVSMGVPGDDRPIPCAMWLPLVGTPNPRPVFLLPHSSEPYPLLDKHRVLTAGGEVRTALALARSLKSGR